MQMWWVMILAPFTIFMIPSLLTTFILNHWFFRIPSRRAEKSLQTKNIYRLWGRKFLCRGWQMKAAALQDAKVMNYRFPMFIPLLLTNFVFIHWFLGTTARKQKKIFKQSTSIADDTNFFAGDNSNNGSILKRCNCDEKWFWHPSQYSWSTPSLLTTFILNHWFFRIASRRAEEDSSNKAYRTP